MTTPTSCITGGEKNQDFSRVIFPRRAPNSVTLTISGTYDPTPRQKVEKILFDGIRALAVLEGS
jgi:hypothetical protein